MDPSQYADYEYIAPIENEGDDIPFPNVISNPISDWNPQVPINTNAESRGDVELPFEPEHKSLTSLLSKRIMEKEPEEIIIEDGHKATIQQVNNEMGETIVHLEDGSYRIMDTEDIYNHKVEDYRCKDIKELRAPKYSEDTGKLYILVRWMDGHESAIDAESLKKDEPMRLAKFIYNHPIERLRSGYWNEWSKNTLVNNHKTIRRIRSIYKNGNYHYTRAHLTCLRHLTKRYIKRRQTQFGILVPNDVHDADILDKENGNSMWGDSVKKEMGGIREHNTFHFLPPGSKPPEGYQEGPLKIIFSVKPDLRRKARMVLGGHKVDSSEYNCHSSMVQLSSIRLLNVIAKSQGLECLAGNIGNAYINAETKEKIYVRCGPEFGPELEGWIAILKKALYGLKSSGNRWHAHFAKTLYNMGFEPTRYDNNVWIRSRMDESGYDYICTYVDDFLIVV